MTEWKHVALGDIVERVRTKGPADDVKVYTVSAAHGLIDQEIYFTRSVASKDRSTYYIVEDGEFVYNKSTSKDAPYGVVARNASGAQVAVTPLYIAFRCSSDDVDPRFLLLACNSAGFFDSLAGTLREGARAHGLLNVRLAEFFGARVALPALAEQRRIVHLIESIDAHIEALEGEALAAARVLTAMCLSLTDPALCDESKRLEEVAEVLDRMRIPLSEAERSQRLGAVPYYGANGQVGWIDEAIFDEPLVLMAEDGGPVNEWQTKPQSYRVDGPSWVNNHAHVLRASGVSRDWLYYATRHLNLEGVAAGGTRSKLTQRNLRSLKIGVCHDESERVAQLHAADNLRGSLNGEVSRLRAVRADVLSALLSQSFEIPRSYHDPLADQEVAA